MNNRIDKEMLLKAPVARVWQALTNHKQFSAWFNINLEGPFVAGKTTRGRLTYPDFKHMVEMQVLEVKPESYFSWHWHPFAFDEKVDYSKETPTLVEFRLSAVEDGTLLKVSESGFDKVPEHRREEAFRMHEEGWIGQLNNIEHYVTEHP